jgi:hypothetical protein
MYPDMPASDFPTDLTVPYNRQFCFTPRGDGLVASVVYWDKIGDRIVARVYAPSRIHMEQLPSLHQPANLGHRIYALQERKRLFPAARLFDNSQIYRIDDRRRGTQDSYLVSVDPRNTELRLLPRTVYHFYGPDSLAPRQMTFNGVLALMRRPEALHVPSESQFPTPQELDNRLTIWDMRTIYRQLRP